jgi:hypothetical protein
MTILVKKNKMKKPIPFTGADPGFVVRGGT